MSDRIEVLPSVLGDLALRVSKGARQYGEPLTTHNGRDGLQDAYEEALDLALYLKQAMLERSAPPAPSVPPSPPVPPSDAPATVARNDSVTPCIYPGCAVVCANPSFKPWRCGMHRESPTPVAAPTPAATTSDESCEVCACRDEDCANPKHAIHPTHAATTKPEDHDGPPWLNIEATKAIHFDVAERILAVIGPGLRTLMNEGVIGGAGGPGATSREESFHLPAATTSEATDPRRVVGAWVKSPSGFRYAVVEAGRDNWTQRREALDASSPPRCNPLDSDVFDGWMTREECERHGIPYVERVAAKPTTPAADEGDDALTELRHAHDEDADHRHWTPRWCKAYDRIERVVKNALSRARSGAGR